MEKGGREEIKIKIAHSKNLALLLHHLCRTNMSFCSMLPHKVPRAHMPRICVLVSCMPAGKFLSNKYETVSGIIISSAHDDESQCLSILVFQYPSDKRTRSSRKSIKNKKEAYIDAGFRERDQHYVDMRKRIFAGGEWNSDAFLRATPCREIFMLKNWGVLGTTQMVLRINDSLHATLYINITYIIHFFWLTITLFKWIQIIVPARPSFAWKKRMGLLTGFQGIPPAHSLLTAGAEPAPPPALFAGTHLIWENGFIFLDAHFAMLC